MTAREIAATLDPATCRVLLRVAKAKAYAFARDPRFMMALRERAKQKETTR